MTLRHLAIGFFLLLATTVSADQFRDSLARQLDLSPSALQSEILRQLDIRRAAVKDQRWAQAHQSSYRLGRAYELVDNRAAALAAFQEAQSYALLVQNEAAAAMAILGQANVLLNNADYETAAKLVLKANDYFTEGTTSADSAFAFTLTGNIAKEQQRMGDAFSAYEKAIQSWISAEAYDQAANQSYELGELALAIGDYEGARLHYQNAIGIFDQLGLTAQMGRALTGIGESFAAEQDWASAQQWAGPAGDLLTGEENRLGWCRWMILEAQLAFAKAEQSEALAKLEEVEQTLAQARPNSLTQELYEQLGNLLLANGAAGQAATVRGAALAQYESWVQDQKQQSLAKQQAKFQLELAVNQYNERIDALEADQSRQRQIRTILLLVLAAALLTAGLLFLMFRRQKHFNTELATKNQLVAEQNKRLESQQLKLENVNNQLELVNNRLLNEIAEREALENTSFARDKFLATVSQEMRTPLNSLVGLTYMLLEDKPRPEQKQHLQELLYAANNLVVFINDILDFSKIEAGKLTLDKREFNFDQSIRDIEKEWRGRAISQDYPLELTTSENIPTNLVGDAARLRQVILGVVEFLIDGSKPGELQLHSAVREIDDDTVWLEFKIQLQTWAGEANFEELFKGYNLYLQNGAANQRQHMSVALTRRLVELQDGRFEVQQRQGKPEIVFILPFDRVGTQTVVSKSFATEHDLENILLGRSILMVEDNRINQLVVKQLLEKNGVSVTVANHGIEGLELFNKQNFDLVLMDIQMPKMDGYRTTAEIRKHPDERKATTPIIALTASAFLSESEKARLFGMDDHIGKPFSPNDLLELIGKTIKTKIKST